MLKITPTLILCFLSGLLARHPNHHSQHGNLQEEEFKEEGFVLSPADRQTELGFDFLQFEDYQDYQSPPLQRRERDGAFHSHQGRRAGRSRQGQRQGRRQSQAGGNRRGQQGPVPDQRQGRQTGDVGLALGVLNNPPREDGSYNFNFANDDGSSRQEIGNPNSDSMLVSGSYSYITPEGEVVEMQYTADENGYHASGSHMPTTPRPPRHVRRLLEHLAKVNGGVFF